jgi:hypothetical protein
LVISCLLKHVIEGKIKGRITGTGILGIIIIRRKQLLDDHGKERMLEVERRSTRMHSGELSSQEVMYVS